MALFTRRQYQEAFDKVIKQWRSAKNSELDKHQTERGGHCKCKEAACPNREGDYNAAQRTLTWLCTLACLTDTLSQKGRETWFSSENFTKGLVFSISAMHHRIPQGALYKLPDLVLLFRGRT